MNDELTTYRIPDSVVHTHDGDSPMAAALCLRCMLDLHIADGELIPVTRCKHQWLPWLRLPNGSDWTECVECDKGYQYDH